MRVPLAKDFPDHHDADLVLRVYDLRREATLRDARRVMTRDYWPATIDDLRNIAQWEHPHNEAFRQFVGYWELVYGLGRHGIVQPEYLVESSGGEAFILLAKLEPFLAQFRETMSPHFLRNTEWAATETEAGREIYGRLRERVHQLRPSR